MPERLSLPENARIMKIPAITSQAILLPVVRRVLVKPTDEEIEKAQEKGKPVPQARIEREMVILFSKPPGDEWKTYEDNVSLLAEENILVENADRINLSLVEHFIPPNVAEYLSASFEASHPFLPEDLHERDNARIIKAMLSEDPFICNIRDAYFMLEKAVSSLVEFQNREDLTTVCLWAIGTYFYRELDTFPYLFINAPKQSGKTRLLQVLERACFYAHPVMSNISAATLFRLLDSNGGTLLIDEIENLQKNEEMKDILSSLFNAGYKKAGQVARQEKKGEGYETKVFEVYGPKAMANITGIGDVLKDRSIVIRLKRSKDPKVTKKSLDEVDWHKIRMAILSGAADAVENLKNTMSMLSVEPEDDEDPLAKMTARERELWLPLLAVAKEVGEDVYHYAVHALRRAIKDRLESGGGLKDIEVMTVQAFYSAGSKESGKLQAIIPTRDIAEEFNYMFSEDLGENITPQKVGRILSRLGFKKAKAGHAGKTKGFLFIKEEVEDYARRYDIEL